MHISYTIYKLRIVIVFLFTIATIFQNNGIKAQLCNGSLGDPVVNINFGTSNVTPNSIAGFKTNYTYKSGDCPNDGEYTITHNSPICFGNSWYLLNTDHTPNDMNGNMMIVNASYAPGDFFVDTVEGLCNSVTYEFAAWLLNLIKPSACNGNSNLPNITFTIETVSGTIIQQYKTGDIATTNNPTWIQYGFFFTAPANTGKIILRMRNNAPGGCGNDLAIDDITFRPCGPKISLATSTGINIIHSCAGDTTHYTFKGNASAGFNNIQYQWQMSSDNGLNWNDIAGATSINYVVSNNQIGNNLYRLSIAEGTSISINTCRVYSDNILFSKEALPIINVLPNNYVCTGDSIIVSASKLNTIQWSGPNAFSITDTSIVIRNIKLIDSGWYKARMVSNYGCINTDSFYLHVKKRPVAWTIPDLGLCKGDTVLLIGGGGETYTWKPATDLSNPNDSITKASPKDTTVYVLYATNGICTDTQSVHINVWQKPTVKIDKVTPLFQGHSTLLTATATGTDVLYNWYPQTYINNANTLNPTVYPDTSSRYYLSVLSSHNCGTAIDSVFIRVYKKLFIPNSFSPNGDGRNDYWIIRNLSAYPNAELMIFNRGGSMIYKAAKNFVQWDGTINGEQVPIGTYYYIINLHEDLSVLSGWLQIIR